MILKGEFYFEVELLRVSINTCQEIFSNLGKSLQILYLEIYLKKNQGRVFLEFRASMHVIDQKT